jgi:hypothetical protein
MPPTIRALDSSVRIDPELSRRLDAAESRGQAVDALVHLRDRPGSSGSLLDPDETVRLARAIVDRAERRVGQQVLETTTFEYLGTFGVLASPALIRVVIAQPEVLSATVPEQVDDSGPAPADEPR